MNRTISILALLIVGLLPACGGDDPAADVDLPPAAVEGREVVRSKGCAACHGSNGGGGVGPSFVGLYGSEVPLQDHDPVIADREYIVESIVDPDAKLVQGYNLPMPRTELSDAEIDAVVAYIEALAEESA
jgi:mono/diheme cytochrome c family protein